MSKITTENIDSQDPLKKNEEGGLNSTENDLSSQLLQQIAKFSEATLKSIRSLRSEIEKIQIEDSKRQEELEKKIKDAEDKIEDSKAKFIEIFGIFVALFTFVSVDISVLRQVNNFVQAASIILITAGILILFVLLLELVMRYWKYDIELKSYKKDKLWKMWFKHYIVLVAIAVSILGASIWLMSKTLTGWGTNNFPETKIQTISPAQ